MTERTSPLVILLVLIFGGFLYVGYQELVAVPSDFPVGRNFTINENETLRSVSLRLEEEGYINSAVFFRAGISFLDKDKDIRLGSYSFDRPYTLLGTMNKFIQGNPDAPLLSVTIPEGSTSFEVASLVARALPQISTDTFGRLISDYKAHGKLFPSTYYLLPSYQEEDILKLMVDTFEKKTETVLREDGIQEPLKNIDEAITLASILEGEANNKEDMEIVAGILIARLKIGMPLQVDVATETYKRKGLPNMPINNPGLVAIMAALHPVETVYLYYITGNDGKMYYAKTFEEHKRNIQKYLR